MIPGFGRCLGEGMGYPLQYFGATLVSQMVKNSPAMHETWVQTLGWEDPLEKGMATHSSILAWRIPLDREAWWATVHRVTKNWTPLATKHKIAYPKGKDLHFLFTTVALASQIVASAL